MYTDWRGYNVSVVPVEREQAETLDPHSHHFIPLEKLRVTYDFSPI